MNREAIVFVHGFNSNSGCWDDLKRLLLNDQRITARFDLRFHEYPAHLVELNPLRVIPSLRALGETLRDHIGTLQAIQNPGYAAITLVGHSLGGLVIQQYLAMALKHHAGSLARIRQVIMIATPSRGSQLFAMARKLLFGLRQNPQEARLRVLDQESGEVVAEVSRGIVNASEHTDSSWPLPLYSFYGTQDGVVLRESARGPCDLEHFGPLAGDHESIIRPRSTDDPNYNRLVSSILEPVGHSNAFEVADYATELCVEPCSPAKTLIVRNGKLRRQIRADNKALFRRTVRFSRGNRCRSRFTLKYATQENGWLKVSHSPQLNEADAPDLAAYERSNGTSTLFAFRPSLDDVSQEYWLKAEILGGYSEGARRIHFHLNTNRAHYGQVKFALDLTRYLRNGWQLVGNPHLWLISPSPRTCDECIADEPQRFEPSYAGQELGTWQWSMFGLGNAAGYVSWEGAIRA